MTASQSTPPEDTPHTIRIDREPGAEHGETPTEQGSAKQAGERLPRRLHPRITLVVPRGGRGRTPPRGRRLHCAR
ncbi:hypothetical protein ACFPRL_01260 [Pseudoclavibacter helvolus]